MRSHCRIALAVVLAAGAARAEDPAPRKYDLNAPDRWAAGEVVTVTSRSETKIVVSSLAEGRAPRERRNQLTDESTIVRRCVETDSAGAPSKSVVFVSAWMHAQDDDEDTSLAGAIVETSRDGWTLLSRDTRPSAAARTWLDEQFGGAARDPLGGSGIRPAAAVVVGENWEPRGCEILDGFVRGFGLPLRLKDVKSSVSLLGVDPSPEGDVVHVVLTAGAALEGDPASARGKALSPQDPSTFELNVSADGVPASWHRSGALHIACGFELTTKAGAETGSLRIRRQQDSVAVAGGAIPELPARKPATAPEFRVARAAGWKAGDSVSDEGSTTFCVTETPVDADGKAGATAAKIVMTRWSDVRRCTEASPAGVPSRFTVWIEKWTSEENGRTDECLKGTLVEVDAKGWKLQNPEVKPTAAARAWLARECGSPAIVASDDSLRAIVTPISPVAVGESWSPDAESAAALVRGWIGLPVDPALASAKATLERADGLPSAADVSVAYVIDAAIACVAGCNCTNAEVLQGGTLKVTGRTRGPAADWTRRGELTEEMKATVSAPGEGDGLRRISIVQTRKRSRAPGGDVPQQ